MTCERIVALVLGTAILSEWGCATTFTPPPELIEARVAYARVAASPAGADNKALLAEAKEFLDGAEAALGKTWEYVVIDKAYVAQRKCELVEVKAETQRIVREVNALAEELREREKK